MVQSHRWSCFRASGPLTAELLERKVDCNDCVSWTCCFTGSSSSLSSLEVKQESCLIWDITEASVLCFIKHLMFNKTKASKLFQQTYRREGNDLSMTHKIGLVEALCGFHFTLKHLDGRQIVVKYPAGKVIEPGESTWHEFCSVWVWNDLLHALKNGVVPLQVQSELFEGKACHSTVTPSRRVTCSSSLTCSSQTTIG